MNPKIGWALALAALVLGWYSYGWQGLLLAFSVIVFWLLLQFSRVLRVLGKAKDAPVGQVASAVMLHTRLRPGMKLMDIIQLTRSLGRKVAEVPERGEESWAWSDAGGVSVEVLMQDGLCASWRLQRPGDAEAEAPAAAGPGLVE
jgi:hypothetical protein